MKFIYTNRLLPFSPFDTMLRITQGDIEIIPRLMRYPNLDIADQVRDDISNSMAYILSGTFIPNKLIPVLIT